MTDGGSDLTVGERPKRSHADDVDRVLQELAVDPRAGLSSEDVSLRRASHGRNVLRTRAPTTIWRLLINQIESPIVYLLAAAAMFAALFGEWKEAIAIVAVLAINTALGFATELRAVRSMEALRRLGSRAVRVRREGQALVVPAEELVPGDIVLLDGGDVITADLRLLECADLWCDESALTGESTAVEKSVEPIAVDATIAERTSMAFKGTAVARGTGAGVVVATGMQTELGKITKLVDEAVPEHSPLEKHLEKLSGQLIWATLTLAGLIAAAGVLSGKDIVLMVQAAIALAVAAIPEGLPIVATMALARGMIRMARRNAIVERLSAVETLGATTVIFTDKTGTLTENRMTVAQVWLTDGLYEVDHNAARFSRDGATIETNAAPSLSQALEVAALCNNATLGGPEADSSGDPMEVALLAAARLAGMDRDALLKSMPEVEERAFDSETKMMATLHNAGDDVLVAVKGAPESVLAHSSYFGDGTHDQALSQDDRAVWLERTETMAAKGLRVLAIATKRDGAGATSAAGATGAAPKLDLENLSFLCLVGLHDPPRADVKDAIAACHSAGMRVVMVTGDHAVTARSIAQTVGLAGSDALVIQGRDLKPIDELRMTERTRLLDCDVYARVSPEQKLDLIALYQAAGEVVAMTGDGVNDAPALKKSDIGVAMGLRGTEVAREAADMVLRDDAFSTIVAAIREGRVIFANIRRFVVYLLSCNLSEVLVVGLAVLVGLPLPLMPLQILFLNLVTDVFPAFALGVGEGDEHVLKRPPRDPKEKILGRSQWSTILGFSLAITIATLGASLFARYSLGVTGDRLITVSFLTLAFAQLWHVFNMRNADDSLIRNAVTMNPFVWGALLLCTLILLAATYLPWLTSLLHVAAPTSSEWTVILVASLLPLAIGQAWLELGKQWPGPSALPAQQA